MKPKELIAAAGKAAEASYSPYSHFRVGAAILLSDGTVIIGTNVENRSFGLTICAERSAFTAAISQGRKDFTALAIVCPDAQTPVSPCGACRQFISEFVPPDFPVYYTNNPDGSVISTTMQELHPQDALHNLKDTL